MGDFGGTCYTNKSKNTCQLTDVKCNYWYMTIKGTISFLTILKSTDFDFFPKRKVMIIMRPQTNHDMDILMDQGKILINLMLAVAENDRLTHDGKGHSYPLLYLKEKICKNNLFPHS